MLACPFVAVVPAGLVAGQTLPSGLIIPSPTITGTPIGVVQVLGQSGTAVNGAADTNENTLATINVPILGANDRLRIHARFAFTNNANNKTLRIRFSGAAGTEYYTVVRTTQVYTIADVEIVNAGATNSQVGTRIEVLSAAIGSAQVTSAVDTSVATTIVISGQKATGTDTLTLVEYSVERIVPIS